MLRARVALLAVSISAIVTALNVLDGLEHVSDVDVHTQRY